MKNFYLKHRNVIGLGILGILLLGGIYIYTRPSDAHYAISCANYNVKKQLKTPSVAVFAPDSEIHEGLIEVGNYWQHHEADNTWTVHSYVDTQNGFGANVRANFTCEEQLVSRFEDGACVATCNFDDN